VNIVIAAIVMRNLSEHISNDVERGIMVEMDASRVHRHDCVGFGILHLLDVVIPRRQSIYHRCGVCCLAGDEPNVPRQFILDDEEVFSARSGQTYVEEVKVYDFVGLSTVDGLCQRARGAVTPDGIATN
jgi:hypothetical protein